MSNRLRSSTRASTVASESLADQIETKATKSETRSRTSSSKSSKNQKLVRPGRIIISSLLFSYFVIAGVVYFALNDVLKLYPNTIKLESLRGFNSRAEFSLRYQTLLYFWLLFMVHSVLYIRITKKALNPLVDATEKHAQAQNNILRNSCEQILISSFLQLSFVSFADPILCLKLIPAVNLVQFLGRIAFFFGYPIYRTFGMSLTMTPNLLMLGYNLYKFGAYLNFY